MAVMRLLVSVPLVALLACAGPQVPKSFATGSPAAPTTAVSQRPDVASVLAAKDPLAASACGDSRGRTVPCPARDGGHDHAGHEAAAPRQEAAGDKAEDHSQHGAPARAKPVENKPASPAQKPASDHEHHHHH
jgi:hypothetical protein